jgi:hypothetical protein
MPWGTRCDLSHILLGQDKFYNYIGLNFILFLGETSQDPPELPAVLKYLPDLQKLSI